MSKSIFDEIVAERDAMVSRARRGTARDDEKGVEEWRKSLVKVLDPSYPPRHMWIKVAAVALRAVEAIDRRAGR